MSNKLKILLAEDEHLCMMGLKHNILNLGHQIAGEATDGMEAVKLAKEEKPDLMIMDINLPKINGIEAIKKINENSFIPSIIVTGYHDEELIKKATRAGVFSYLVKPIDCKDIKAAIEVALARFEEFKDLRTELEDTKEALEARKYIERAKGILMDQKGLKEHEAMKKLQTISRNNNKKLFVIAKEIIKADELLN